MEEWIGELIPEYKASSPLALYSGIKPFKLRFILLSTTGDNMLLVEMNVPRYMYMQIVALAKGNYRDVIREVTKSKSTGFTRVFIEDSPKGWWVALKILRKGSGRLYLLREVKYMDIPSKLMELSMELYWKPEYEKVIEEELKRWGLNHE